MNLELIIIIVATLVMVLASISNWYVSKQLRKNQRRLESLKDHLDLLEKGMADSNQALDELGRKYKLDL